jgi:periplasmic copper chaperone A
MPARRHPQVCAYAAPSPTGTGNGIRQGVIQTPGDTASGHHVLMFVHRVIQTSGGTASGHHAPAVPECSNDARLSMRTTFPLLLALPVLLTATSTAFAHAHLQSATPPGDATVATPPLEVEITFTEGVEPRFSTIEVTNPKGERVDLGAPHSGANNKELAVKLKPVTSGTYTVVWHATSVDTHKTEGHYVFTVGSEAAGGISVDKAWARPSVGASMASAAYFTVTDPAGTDRLVALSTPAATSAELHESFSDNGVMKMRPVAGLTLDQGKPVSLAPGGYHVMLTGLKQPLKAGDSFPLTLKFEHAAPVTITVPVQTSAAAGTGMSMPGHTMDHAK